MRPPAPSFTHLRRLTDDNGLFEHARGVVPRRDGGYCVDDVARALVVVGREADPAGSSPLHGLAEVYLSFLLAAQADDGRFHNRFGTDRRWHDQPSVEDCWGRALWGLGEHASARPDSPSGQLALDAFTVGARRRSPWSHPMAFAALGAAAVLHVLPDHPEARSLLAAAAHRIGRPRVSHAWPWPEDRLTYANALLPEVLLAAGAALDDDSLRADGLALLGWLLDLETRDGHLSVTPVGGRGPGDTAPGFDQQPIEVAALADACARAYAITADPRWADGLELAVAWFLGLNDAGTSLYDSVSGGGCDGLERHGRNENQGAESTLAVLSTLQQGRRLPVLSR
ncbi:MAG: glycosyltransferase [Actinomycetes bacterium]